MKKEIWQRQKTTTKKKHFEQSVGQILNARSIFKFLPITTFYLTKTESRTKIRTLFLQKK